MANIHEENFRRKKAKEKNTLKEIILEPGMMTQVDLCEFNANLAYIVSSRTAKLLIETLLFYRLISPCKFPEGEWLGGKPMSLNNISTFANWNRGKARRRGAEGNFHTRFIVDAKSAWKRKKI